MTAHSFLDLQSLSEFERYIRSAREPIFVDFWASLCPAGLREPDVRSVLDAAGTAVSRVRVNVDEAPAIVDAYGVRRIPTVLIFRGGEPVFRSGSLEEAEPVIRALRGSPGVPVSA